MSIRYINLSLLSIPKITWHFTFEMLGYMESNSQWLIGMGGNPITVGS